MNKLLQILEKFNIWSSSLKQTDTFYQSSYLDNMFCLKTLNDGYIFILTWSNNVKEPRSFNFMPDNRDKQIPCIVGKGVITSKKDMTRLLKGFDHVKFTDIIDGTVEIEDEAYVVEVFSHDTESTIVFNRRMYINVENFEYLRIIKNQPGTVELIEGHRVLKLEAMNDPFNNKDILMSESIENRANIEGLYEEEDIIFDDDF